jgi:transcription elongation factor GreA
MSDNNKTYLSQEKYDDLKKELEELKSNKRKEIAEKLEYAKSLGDLSENTEYQEAREAQANIEDRISTIEGLLKDAVIVSERKGDKVDIGSSVSVTRNGNQETYHIVGSEEADVSQSKISNQSPLGEALMGKQKGEEFTYKTPKGEMNGKIEEIY